MKESFIPRTDRGETPVNPHKEEAIQRGVAPQTYDFLVTAIQTGAHNNLDIRRRNLIGIYFGTKATLQQLAPIASVTTGARVSQLIKSGLQNLWLNLPPELQERHPQGEVVKLKRGFSPESRAKISEAHKGRKHSPETREKMSETHKGRPSPLKGRKLPPETRAKISEALTGRKHSPESREKMSEARKKRRVRSE